ncbi:hypothetical protein [Novosphingobium album (ex Hu et al. 2023)]|uniref:Uncharacterized protein n=1 Tax=Novosphingobium album (ex Hu et al. 2023) TaxID=2930093 RepID=A0ABT0AZJ7_9SPHN|nr:hypothetical protein [Novosphingobium album (ex Hu et al. 2023)]MCJ2178190.1 hypothetical protein [Novosphingobium album (ex Hu et al. 2023)]
MNMAITHTGRHQASHAHPANFGQLNSAIARGDLEAAQSAYAAINESTSPSAMAAKGRSGFDTVGTAIESGDLGTARKALADFRSGRAALTAGAAETAGITAETTATATETTASTTETASTSDSAPVIDASALQTETVSPTEQIATLLSGSGSTVEIIA